MPLSPQNKTFLTLCSKGSAYEVDQAIRAGADLLSLNGSGKSALHLAVEHDRSNGDRLDVVDVLLHAGMDPDTPHASVPLPPLMQAIDGNKALVVARLLKAGASPHGHHLAGLSPLTLALLHGRSRCALALVDAGASWTHAENPGITPDRLREPWAQDLVVFVGARTPLHTAAQGGHHDWVDHLLKQGASVQAIDDGGFTPLHHAVFLRRIGRGGGTIAANKTDLTMARIARRLIEAGASLDVRDKAGRTPLDLARENDRIQRSPCTTPLLIACLEQAELRATLDHQAQMEKRAPVTTARPSRRL